MISTPTSSKCRTSLVATAACREMAMAAIRESLSGTGLPARWRRAAREACSRAASLSKTRTRPRKYCSIIPRTAAAVCSLLRPAGMMATPNHNSASVMVVIYRSSCIWEFAHSTTSCSRTGFINSEMTFVSRIITDTNSSEFWRVTYRFVRWEFKFDAAQRFKEFPDSLYKLFPRLWWLL